MTQTLYSQTATSGNVVSTGSGNAWTPSGASLTSDLSASDDVRATASLSTASPNSQFLWFRSFGFSVPDRATIMGVTLDVERSKSGLGRVDDLQVQLLVNNTLSGDNKASTTKWPTSDAMVSYGAAHDQWGNSLSPSDVNDSQFGCALRCYLTTSGTPTARVDYLTMTVWYSLPAVVLERVFADGGNVRATYSIRCDGNGGALIDLDEFKGMALCAIRVTPQSVAPAFDVTVESHEGDDLLSGELLNLSNAIATTARPFVSSADADESQPLIVPPGALLKVENAGADGSLVIDVMATKL